MLRSAERIQDDAGRAASSVTHVFQNGIPGVEPVLVGPRRDQPGVLRVERVGLVEQAECGNEISLLMGGVGAVDELVDMPAVRQVLHGTGAELVDPMTDSGRE